MSSAQSERANDCSQEKMFSHPHVVVSPRGKFIVFEGADRSGKTTQVAKLVESLQRVCDGSKVQAWRFPNRTTSIGKLIHSYLTSGEEMDDRAIHLLFSANRWEMAKELETTLASGTHVICDRYMYSGWVYTLSKQLPTMNPDWVVSCDKGLPEPDLVLLLNVSPDVISERGGFGNERYETKDQQRIVNDHFKRMQLEGEKIKAAWHLIDATQDADQVGIAVLSLVEKFFFKKNS